MCLWVTRRKVLAERSRARDVGYWPISDEVFRVTMSGIGTRAEVNDRALLGFDPRVPGVTPKWPSEPLPGRRSADRAGQATALRDGSLRSRSDARLRPR